MTTLRGKPGCAKGVSPASLLCPGEPPHVASAQWLGATSRRRPWLSLCPLRDEDAGGSVTPPGWVQHPPLCPSRLIQLPSFSACVCPRPLCLHVYFLLKPSFLLLLIHSIEFQSFSKNYYFFLVKRCISSISLHSLLKPHRTTPKGLANNKIINDHHKKK